MVHNGQMSISERWDGWLTSLVETFDSTVVDERIGRCAPVSCVKARNVVLAHLSQPKDKPKGSRPEGLHEVSDFPGYDVYSPAICNLGRLPRSMPRSLASSCIM